MSKACGEEEDEDECFYESLDRIVASSPCSCSTSTSNSNSDADADSDSDSNYASHRRRHFPTPKFPLGAHSYDVWIHEPSSISDRRSRLLREMGLSSDPALSRSKPDPPPPSVVWRSVSSDHLITTTPLAAVSPPPIARSKSDGVDQCLSDSSPILCSETTELNSFVNTQKRDGVVVCKSPSGNSNGSCSSVAANVSSPPPNKPPSGKNSRRSDEIRIESRLEDLDCNGNAATTDTGGGAEVCTIRNLDNGKEFVVNEIREDGMWDKLKEVGTGKQLTMEEFEMSVGHSPIVQELMRRQNVEESHNGGGSSDSNANGGSGGAPKMKKRGWFKSIKSVASTMTGHKERRSSDERDTSSEKGGRRSSSATDDSQDVSFHGPERVRVRQYGKSCKELTAVYKTQEIPAHNGSIWSIKFSLDGKFLASAGEDCVIHIWQVMETQKKGELLMQKAEDNNLDLFSIANGSSEPSSVSPNSYSHLEKKRRGRSSISRKSLSLEHYVIPETMFALSEKPICSFQGHEDDVLDLSWSKSQHLLSSSMDKTVRLWHLSSTSCLRIFSHIDYVTCIQFNPVDDKYFISGSLDAKVRIWSIPDRQVVDWNDLHEMVTSACYTPDGQGALVGTYKGSCRLYNTSENKLQQKSQINLQNKKKKSHHKKITGFQFAPGSSSEVLVTSADSRIRVVDGTELVHKFKGFRNTNSQISATLTANGKYVVSASEDSHVYIWKHEADSRPGRSKSVTVTRSYEHFHCHNVSVAVSWPGIGDSWGQDGEQNVLGLDNNLDEVSTANHPPTPVEQTNGNDGSRSATNCANSPLHGTISSASNSYFFDRISATWPEEKLLLATKKRSPRVSFDLSNGVSQNIPAWGMVIVTAGLGGEIRTFQNFGLPIRI